jgi:hypothetical protein
MTEDFKYVRKNNDGLSLDVEQQSQIRKANWEVLIREAFLRSVVEC